MWGLILIIKLKEFIIIIETISGHVSEGLSRQGYLSEEAWVVTKGNLRKNKGSHVRKQGQYLQGSHVHLLIFLLNIESQVIKLELTILDLYLKTIFIKMGYFHHDLFFSKC